MIPTLALSMLASLTAPSPENAAAADGLCERVECTAEQRREIATIKKRFHSDTAQDRMNAFRLRDALRVEMNNPDRNPDTMAALWVELIKARQAMRDEAKKARKAVRKHLTPAQRRQLKRAMKKRRPAKRDRGNKKRLASKKRNKAVHKRPRTRAFTDAPRATHRSGGRKIRAATRRFTAK